jgi:hypothetical protein
MAVVNKVAAATAMASWPKVRLEIMVFISPLLMGDWVRKLFADGQIGIEKPD